MLRRIVVEVVAGSALILAGGCIFGPVDPIEEGDDGDDGDGEDIGAMDEGMGSMGGYCDTVTDWDPNDVSVEQRVIDLVNHARSLGGDCAGQSFPPSGPLSAESALTCAARVHSVDMATRGFFDHVNPDGEDPFVRMERAGYTYRTAAENIAAGQPSADEVVGGWLASPGHCRNILNPDFVHIGVGYVATDAAEYPFYWTQTFGAPL